MGAFCVFGLTLNLLAADASAQKGTEARYFNDVQKQDLRAQASPEDQPYVVDVGSRLIQPGLDKEIPFEAARAAVYLQFHETPTAAERRRLTQLGVSFYGAIDEHTYLARIKEDDFATIKSLPSLRGIEPVEYADRMTEGIFYGRFDDSARTADGKWSVYVRFYEDVRLPHALYVLDKYEIKPTDDSRLLFNHRLLIQASWEQLFDLAEDKTVRSLDEAPLPARAHNNGAQQLHNVDAIQGPPYDVDGTGVIMGLWDQGPVRSDHSDLTGRVTNVELTNPVSDHATHVAGTIMGDGTGDPMAEGMAPGVQQLFSCDFDGDPVTEMQDAITNHGIVIASHSWGSILGWDDSTGSWVDTGNQNLFGEYDSTARDWDTLVHQTGLIITKSAGNDADDCNAADCDGVTGSDGHQYATVGTHGNAKNVITVGAIDDTKTIAPFSSAGPAKDGRIVPTVVASGVDLSSAWNAGSTDPSCVGMDYCDFTGTSTATGAVSGIVALLVDRYREQNGGVTPTPDILRALLVNTAEDLGLPGPDYLYGFGSVDALAAVETIDAGQPRVFSNAIDHGELQEYMINVPPGLSELRVTTAWTDPAAAAGASPALVNNIDVIVYDPQGNPHYPFTGPVADFTSPATNTGPNAIDNVEMISVDSPTQGLWSVQVQGNGVPSGPQTYSTAINVQSLGFFDLLNFNAPLTFPELCPGEFQDVTVWVFNTSLVLPRILNSITVDDTTNYTVVGPLSTPIVIPGGGFHTFTVRFHPTTPGTKPATVTVNLELIFATVDIDLPATGSGGAPEATSLAPGFFFSDFGNVLVGDVSVLEFQVINTGTCNLELGVPSLFAISGNGGLSFTSIAGFPSPIFPGETIAFPVEYRPTSFGSLVGGTLTIPLINEPSETEIVFDFIGRSDPPILTTTGSTDFGLLCSGDVSEIVFNICNTGFNNLDVTSVDLVEVMGLTMTGPPAPGPATALAFMGDDMVIMGTGGGPMPGTERGAVGPFSLVNSPFPAEVSKDFCLPLTLRMEATVPGDFEANLVITTDDPAFAGMGGELVVPITGSVGTGDLMINLEANGLFESVLIGDNKTLILQVQNDGPCTLTFLVTPLTNDPEITVAPQFPDVNWFLAPGEHLNIPFTYTPVDFDNDLATWLIASDDPFQGNVQFDLRGRSEAPDIRVTGSTDFGVVCPGDLAEKVIDICNVGFNNLDVTEVDFYPECDDFELINNPFPAEVSKDFCMPLTIRYTPTGVGMHSCNLRILSDDPDEPEINLTVTGETPPSLISVPDDIEFPATVVQKVDVNCKSPSPFQIENVGVCPLEITDVVLYDTLNYEFVNLPALPVTLLPGESLGDGTLMIVFKPEVVQHQIPTSVKISYVSNDPNLGDVDDVYVQLCGEGVKTGARILAVDENGVPVPLIHKLQLWKNIDGGGTFLIEQTNNLPPQVVPDNPPCTGFTFHHEWGGETNPIVLEPGNYRAEVVIGFRQVNVDFTIEDECDFIPDLVAVFFP